jgi:deoxyribodipyrimidine photolyase-like uncharacterized protein
VAQSSKHHNLIAVFGDQLSEDIHALRLGDRDKDLILMAEVMDEATYAHHHKKKLAFVFFGDAPFRGKTLSRWVDCSIHQTG